MSGLTVIKCGGSTMAQLPAAFFHAIAELQRHGHRLVMVHGGGPAINAMLQKLNIPPQFVDGLRVTCEQTMDVVEMVLAGSINKQLVRRLSQAGAKAWGASGLDAGLLKATLTTKPLGLVGEHLQVDPALVFAILENGCVPVLAPLAADIVSGQVLNVNADAAAGAIAASLGAERLVLVTDVPGILQPHPTSGQELLAETDAEHIARLIETGVIHGGMIPKVQSALDALAQGVQHVVICRGTAEDLYRICSGQPAGTAIRGGVRSR